MFITFILLWLRTHGIHTPIHIQADNGLEFCMGSKRKEIELNDYLKQFNASFTSIPAGKKYLQGVIERSHITRSFIKNNTRIKDKHIKGC